MTPEALSLDERECLLRGIALIHSGAYFEAHEEIESAWANCRSSNRRFLQAIIHVAVGCHHHVTGNALGRERQFRKAIRKLEAYPDGHAGLDVLGLLALLRAALAAEEGVPWDPRILRISLKKDAG
jgi:predicted metal-dependent hydrolase